MYVCMYVRVIYMRICTPILERIKPRTLGLPRSSNLVPSESHVFFLGQDSP